MADDAGLTLVGLARGERCEVFTHPHRITPDEAAHVA
ncbi:formate dehydrogenase accessory sulfurtransferase FdhD [Rhodovulum sulfidophilum]|nr:formate dehydrogenase accessory sulfurtransferase FdhD [Rhodovulum sulfidophilum]